MSESYIPAHLRRLVEQRANFECEYCQLPSGLSFFPHEIDHIIAEKHGGKTEAENLAYSCWRCNRHKGTDLGSFDPENQEFCFLFNPRTQKWSDHFTFNGVIILGLTPEGRTTTQLLQLNTEDRLKERQQH
jgi:hypothetical protein